MIIFGTTGLKSTIKTGQFLCPQCATEKSYRHRKINKFFTLYFIPLIPLGSAGEYVECNTCKGTFVPRVLDYNPQTEQNQFQSEYEKAMRFTMIKMMLADGEIDENEMLIVQKIINKFGHHDLTLDQLEQLVKKVENSNKSLSSYLTKISGSLNEHGKEIIIKCAYSVAAADGHIDDSEIAMIKQIAKDLDMSSSHLKGILQEMANPEPKFSEN